MLRSLNQVRGYTIRAEDGVIGAVRDFLFDDQQWALRYVDVSTHVLLSGKRVLLSMESVLEPDWGAQSLPVKLTRNRIEQAPSIDQHKPVSRQHELDLLEYYGWAPYWHTGTVSGAPFPVAIRTRPAEESGSDAATQTIVEEVRTRDAHLRSVKEITGYHIRATDGKIGHVEDVITETDGWRLRHFVVDTRNWLPGRKVLISLEWCDQIDWHTQQLYVGLTRVRVRDSPPFDATDPINHEFEMHLYDYYGRPAHR